MPDRETPPRRTVAPAVAAAVLVVVVTYPVPIAGLVATIGVGAVIIGLTRGSRGVVLVGVTIQFGSVLVAALGALRFELVLVASLAVLFAWDFGEQAISIVEQLGVAGGGTRPLVVHAAGASLVGTLLFVGVYGLYRLAGNGQPVSALALLLGGGVLVVAGMRL